jgi:UDP-N-acetylglucosamine 4,6-dehydratase/5-epimerase
MKHLYSPKKGILMYKKSSVLLLLLLLMPHSSKATRSHHHILEDKVIVITGGAGFLGKGLIQAILPYNPREIRIFSRDEVKHALCQQEFSNHPRLTFILGDRRDYDALLYVTRGADIVIDAGAHKRIDMMESNVQECIKTNIIGTMHVFNACVANNVERALFISTDKSASPINIYGASKFVSEKIFTNYEYSKIKTIFSTVRYGNVMHSTGSVIPFFINKIKNGETLTLTDPRMTRFIISIEEAIELIFMALHYSVGGETFVKKLPALTIVDLIEILKKKYNGDNPIVVTGIRPGEKIHETLINDSEAARTYDFDNLYVITPTLPHHEDTQIPLYKVEGTLLNAEAFGNYSSDKCLITQDEADALFNKLNLYQKLSI